MQGPWEPFSFLLTNTHYIEFFYIPPVTFQTLQHALYKVIHGLHFVLKECTKWQKLALWILIRLCINYFMPSFTILIIKCLVINIRWQCLHFVSWFNWKPYKTTHMVDVSSGMICITPFDKAFYESFYNYYACNFIAWNNFICHIVGWISMNKFSMSVK